MKKKIYLLPLALLSALLLITWGCEDGKTDEDVCALFVLTPKVSCEDATLCCPIDDSDCYIVNPEGGNFYCNAKNATPSDKEGCAEAEAAYIKKYCSKSITKAEEALVINELRQHFQNLMEEARTYSVCY